MAHGIQIVIACDDPGRLTAFWGAALGYVEEPPPPEYDSWAAFADDLGIPEDRRWDLSAAVDPSRFLTTPVFGSRFDEEPRAVMIAIHENGVEVPVEVPSHLV